MDERIESIAQAGGWQACYRDGRQRPLACWAMVDGRIVGMVADNSNVVPVDQVDGFVGFWHPGR